METAQTQIQDLQIDRSRYDEAAEVKNEFVAKPGLSEELVRFISKSKNEPEWMLEKRLLGLKFFNKTSLPNWGPDLSELDLNSIIYFVKPGVKESKKWEDLPEEIRKTAERIGIPEAERNSLGGTGFQFDCLTEDTLVYTNPRGAVKIKDIHPGDTVFSYDEKSNSIVCSRVNAILDKGKLPILEVKVAGRTIKATSNHPFLTLIDKRKEGKTRARFAKEWKLLINLKEGDVVAIATDLPNMGRPYMFPGTKKENNLPKSTSEDLMWFIGLFLGDGWISRQKNKASVRLAIPQSQNQLRNEVVNVCQKLFNYKVISLYKDLISINSVEIASFLESIGLVSGAQNKKVPDWAFSLPKNEMLALLGGYLDSDGTVRDHKTSKDVVYTSISPSLLEEIKHICTYCGLQSSKITTFFSKYTYKNKTVNKIGHRLHVSGDTSMINSRFDFKKDRLNNKTKN